MPSAILIDASNREKIVAELPFDATDLFDESDYIREAIHVESYLIIDGSVAEGNFVANAFSRYDLDKNWNYDMATILFDFVALSAK